MAVQAVDLASGEKTEVPENSTTNGSPARSTPQERAQHAVQSIVGTAEHYGTAAVQRGRDIMDRILPPEQRATLVEKVQAFVSASPKLAAFLALNLVLTGIPLILFVLFAISTFVVSLLVALVAAVLVAVTFTLFSVGAALLVVLPTILLTTFAASSIFLWGLSIFAVYRFVQARTEKGVAGAETRMERKKL